MELHPHDQSGVRDRHRRAGVAGRRSVDVRRWDAIVRAWAAGDERALDDEWTDEVPADPRDLIRLGQPQEAQALVPEASPGPGPGARRPGPGSAR